MWIVNYDINWIISASSNISDPDSNDKFYIVEDVGMRKDQVTEQNEQSRN